MSSSSSPFLATFHLAFCLIFIDSRFFIKYGNSDGERVERVVRFHELQHFDMTPQVRSTAAPFSLHFPNKMQSSLEAPSLNDELVFFFGFNFQIGFSHFPILIHKEEEMEMDLPEFEHLPNLQFDSKIHAELKFPKTN